MAEDLAQARTPTPAALALSHKLASTGDGGYRYTCPSYELTRREDPESVAEVLEWALEPVIA